MAKSGGTIMGLGDNSLGKHWEHLKAESPAGTPPSLVSNKWETMDHQTQRMKIPGGWLVRVNRPGGVPAGLTTVNDPGHLWQLVATEKADYYGNM